MVDINFEGCQYLRQGAMQYALKHAGRVVSFGAAGYPQHASEMVSKCPDDLGAFGKLKDLTLSGQIAYDSDLTPLPPGLTRLKLHMWLGASRINWAVFARLQQLARLNVRAQLCPRATMALVDKGLLDMDDNFAAALPRLNHFSLSAVVERDPYPISVAASSSLLHLTNLKLKSLELGALDLRWMPALQTLTLKQCYFPTLVSPSLKNLAIVNCIWEGALRVPPEVTTIKMEMRGISSLDGSQCRHKIVVTEVGRFQFTDWCGERVPEIMYMPAEHSD